MLYGVQVDIDTIREDQSVVDLFLGKELAPGFFAWVLPCKEFTRVGLCVSKGQGTPYSYLRKLLEQEGLDKSKRVRLTSGAIPIGPPKRTHADNIMIVGDAAGQTKPLSGGGLYTGMIAAEHAALTAEEAISSGDTSVKTLCRYDERWRKDIGRENQSWHDDQENIYRSLGQGIRRYWRYA